MTKERRILTPITTSLAGMMVVAAATLGGTFAADTAAEKKTDRFQMVGDSLCEGQAWPNLTPECLSWAQGESMANGVRFVTIAEEDREAHVTTLTKIPAQAGN
jgi:hypothetical protein